MWRYPLSHLALEAVLHHGVGVARRVRAGPVPARPARRRRLLLLLCPLLRLRAHGVRQPPPVVAGGAAGAADVGEDAVKAGAAEEGEEIKREFSYVWENALFWRGRGGSMDHGRSGILESLYAFTLLLFPRSVQPELVATGIYLPEHTTDQRRCVHRSTFKLSEALSSRKALLSPPRENVF